MSSIYLNATTLSDLNSLILTLIPLLVCKADYIQNFLFHVLISSGSTYCFINAVFAYKHNISTIPIPLVKLKLFDRLLNNLIFKTISLSIIFLSNDQIILYMYFTLLNFSCLLVPRYNCLLTSLLDLLLSNQTYKRNFASLRNS